MAMADSEDWGRREALVAQSPAPARSPAPGTAAAAERSRVCSMQMSALSGSGKKRMTEKKLSNFSAGYFCVPRVALTQSLLARPQGAAWQMGKGCPGGTPRDSH